MKTLKTFTEDDAEFLAECGYGDDFADYVERTVEADAFRQKKDNERKAYRSRYQIAA